MSKRLARKNFLETSLPTLRRRKVEILYERVRCSVLMGLHASLALVLEFSVWKLLGRDFCAAVLHCHGPTAGRCFTPDHEIDMFWHGKSLEWLKILQQPDVV